MKIRSLLLVVILSIFITNVDAAESLSFPLLIPAKVVEVKLKEIVPHPTGTGRNLVFEITTDVCTSIIGQLKGSPPQNAILQIFGATELSAAKLATSCTPKVYLFNWDPNLNEKKKQAKMRIDFIGENKKGYRAHFRAFRTKGDQGPGSAITDIVDYDNVKIQVIK